MKKSHILKVLFCLLPFIGQSQITYNPNTALCGTNVIIASYDCMNEVRLSPMITGSPDGVSITDVSQSVGGSFTFQIHTEVLAPTSIEIIWTITESLNDPVGCAIVGNQVSTQLDIDCTCNPAMSATIINESCLQCNDGQAELFVTGIQGAVSADWSDGGFGLFRDNLEPGIHTVTAYSEDQECFITDQFTVNPYECQETVVNASLSEPVCFEACNGTATVLELDNDAEIISVLWDDGTTDMHREGLCEGLYYATVTAGDNCQYFLEIPLVDPPLLTVVVAEVDPGETSGEGEIIMDVEGGVPPYLYTIFQNGLALEHEIDQHIFGKLEYGCYDIQVSDTYGCMIDIEDVCVDKSSSLRDLHSDHFSVYPNPVTNFITIESRGEEISSLQLFTIDGRLVRREEKELRMDVSDLTDGLYVLKVETPIGQWSDKVYIAK